MTYFLAVFSKHPKIVPGRKERVRIVLSSIMIISPHWCGYGILLFTVNMYRTFQKVFIRTYPVYREVFAAAFIDRVVHHWIALRIEPILEERFSGTRERLEELPER